MTKRTLILVPMALLLVAFGCKQDTDTNTFSTNSTTTSNTPIVVTNSTASTTVNFTVNTQTSSAERDLQRLASSFAERYGSFSNQTNYENLESLLPFMTADYQTSTEQLIATERAKPQTTDLYYGMTTRATSVQTELFDDVTGQAAFSVYALRNEAIGTTANAKSFQAQLVVTLKKETGVWRVENAEWMNSVKP